MEVDMKAYGRKRNDERVVFLVSSKLLQDLDAWGINAGKINRSEAIRALITAGLDSDTHNTNRKKTAAVSA